MTVNFSENGGEGKEEDLVRRGVVMALDAEGAGHAELSVTFLDDDGIQRLNREYLGRDRPTDVIAFSLDADGVTDGAAIGATDPVAGDATDGVAGDTTDGVAGDTTEGVSGDITDGIAGDITDGIASDVAATAPVLGDIYIGVDQARRQAHELGVDFREEVVRLAIHGTLHVLGHDHPEDGDRDDCEMYHIQERLVSEVFRAD